MCQKRKSFLFLLRFPSLLFSPLLFPLAALFPLSFPFFPFLPFFFLPPFLFLHPLSLSLSLSDSPNGFLGCVTIRAPAPTLVAQHRTQLFALAVDVRSLEVQGHLRVEHRRLHHAQQLTSATHTPPRKE